MLGSIQKLAVEDWAGDLRGKSSLRGYGVAVRFDDDGREAAAAMLGCGANAEHGSGVSLSFCRLACPNVVYDARKNAGTSEDARGTDNSRRSNFSI
jgi:hypothetical protein